MPMTKRHFDRFATAIKNLPLLADRRAIADIVIEISTADNPRFNPARFLTACGIIPENPVAVDLPKLDLDWKIGPGDDPAFNALRNPQIPRVYVVQDIGAEGKYMTGIDGYSWTADVRKATIYPTYQDAYKIARRFDVLVQAVPSHIFGLCDAPATEAK